MKKNEHRFDKSICNEIANLIINKQKEIKYDLSSKIWVTWVDRFFVINGFTDLINVFDVSSFVNDELSNKYEDWLPINIIDLVDYGSKNFTKNKNLPSKTYNIKSNDEFLKTNFDPTQSKMLNKFIKPIISDDFYGLSLNFKKPHILSLKIANHIFNANYTSNQVKICFEDDRFIIHLEGGTVSNDFVTNVVDTCFGGKIEDEYEKMNLEEFDFINTIEENIETYPWKIRDHMKDFMMI